MNESKGKVSGKFILCIGIAIFLTYVPILGSYVGVINTVIHESGHAFMALLGGNVHEIQLFMNTEGVTYSRHTSWISAFFTGLAGYTFSSFIAFVSIWLISKQKYKSLIFILLAFIALNLIFWVRNFYGLFWLGSFGAGFLLLLYKGHPTLVKYALLLIACILLVESFTSSFEIMVLSFMQPQSAGDATVLSKASLFIPAQLWGMFFLLQAVLFLLIGWRKKIFRV
ncbi:M50 family metallopeptidase [Bacillus sp. T33-2]|uniref:M50 family metallopeptidase n=1 Tax=Bacillus sp. T33-2 TaxID=2054168 RepID=UPI000C785515|nr:M50 family metallopeptidase [Bacillus sp. T33-2]PLR98415.1 hypothetical protein CVD19_04845 [Bacillus sp. T33-2]